MLELSIALKYLVPRKKNLSTTLIALMSTGVIALVVWLLLVFLSVTEGMESLWLKKLTDLNAPIRITPTEKYYSSYFYKIDKFSSASDFCFKTLGEKRKAPLVDPYDPEEDMELPFGFPLPERDSLGKLVDPVERLEKILHEIPYTTYQDYETSGATLKLQMEKPAATHFLTQVTYLTNPPSSSILSSLLMPPTTSDIEHLFFLTLHRRGCYLSLNDLIDTVKVQSIAIDPANLLLSIEDLPKEELFTVYGTYQEGKLSHLIVPLKAKETPILNGSKNTTFRKGTIRISQDLSSLLSIDNETISLSNKQPFSFTQTLHLAVEDLYEKEGEIFFLVKGKVQGKEWTCLIPFSLAKITSFSLNKQVKAPKGFTGVILPKGFQASGSHLGDGGFLSYTSATTGSLQEQRTPIFVEGFYDPGILPIGSRCLLVPQSVTRAINQANTTSSFDKISLNGFQVWFSDLQKTPIIKKKLKDLLQKEGIEEYWKVTSFAEYDFSKDLFTQFQSDKYLFSLVGIIILIVASCNILSMLVILVKDKKREIAILRSMGTSKKSIGAIFGLCGVLIGSLGAFVGIFAAFLTVRHMDTLVHFLSIIQGREAFQESFYGSCLPSVLSTKAIWFIAILIPILSIFAGVIPAIKAARLSASAVLRGDS